jgi:hypothetical protein
MLSATNRINAEAVSRLALRMGDTDNASVNFLKSPSLNIQISQRVWQEWVKGGLGADS